MKFGAKNKLVSTSVGIGSLAVGMIVGTMATIAGTTFLSNMPDFGGLLSLELLLVATVGCAGLGIAAARQKKQLTEQTRLSKRQALELEQQRLALNTHSIVIVTNPEGIMTCVNQKFCDVWGYSRDEVIGKPVSSLYPAGANDLDFQQVHSRVRSGKVWSGEMRMVHADGSYLNTLGTTVPMFDEQGVHIQNVSVRTDITALRKNEKAHFLKALLDNLTDEVYIFDVETLAMQYMNIRAKERVGWLGQDITQKRIVDTDPNFVEEYFRHHVEPLLSGEAETVTVETVQQKGPVEINTRLYTGEDNQRLFISVLRDTTERAQLEKARLESVSVISHELRTPLTSIKGALRLLQSGALGDVSEQAKPVLDIADRNSDRLLLVVNDILDLEKIRAGKVEFDLKRKDMVAFLQDAVEMNKGYADEHGVKIDFQTDMEAAFANIETDRLMQVMSNLISNAVKFSPKGDTVLLELHRDGKHLRIGVRDNGPGIPESDRGSVFESFKQLESPDGVKRVGTGLGLAISKTIIRSHSGRLDYRSKVGKGSTFFFELPSLDDSGNVVPIMAGRTSAA